MKGDVPSQLRWGCMWRNEGFKLLGHSPGLRFAKSGEKLLT